MCVCACLEGRNGKREVLEKNQLILLYAFRAVQVLEREVRGCDDRLWSVYDKVRERRVMEEEEEDEAEERVYVRRRY